MSDGHAASYQVLARIDAAGGRVTINPRKANPAKAGDAKPRILVSAVAAATRVTRQPGCLAPGNKETNMRMQTRLISAALLAIAALLSNTVLADELFMEAVEYQVDIYDEAAYTEYAENTMKKLDALYLDFCATCGVDATKSRLAREEFLATVRELMQHMNARYDALDPKAGAALSPTETLVSIHAMTMLVDMLAAVQIEQMAYHPYNE
jgi:hypothetical protein